MKESTEIVISFIICSRNDNYMGNPIWRLETSLNFISENIFELGRQKDVEILVSDWGSKIPISHVIRLTERAESLTSFIHIDEKVASNYQKDSSFAEVYALNIAARRSRGEYIARIDQDTLVQSNFLKKFFAKYDSGNSDDFELRNTYMFATRKQLPYSFVSESPEISDIRKVIEHFGKWMYPEELSFCHWASPAGILLMHREMWHVLGGYDERLIYYWYMDVDLGARIKKKYPIVNIGLLFGYDFFHLEHIPKNFNFRYKHRKLNPTWAKSFKKSVLNPNGENWGLAFFNFKQSSINKNRPISLSQESHLSQKKMREIFLMILIDSSKRFLYSKLKFILYLSKRLLLKEYL